jgi:predicted Zn-dependent protease
MIRRLALALLALLLASGGAFAQEPLSSDEAGPNLRYIRFSLAGKPVDVRAGGILALHPDVPFRVVEAKTDAWFNFGLRTRLSGMPMVDLNNFHTLSELLGPKVYEGPELKVQALKDGQVLGEVSLDVSLLPIDWLRRAEEAQSVDKKIAFTEKAWQLTPDDRLLLTRLVDLMVEAKRYKEAVELLEGQSLQEDDAKLLRRLAGLYERAGQKEKAAAALSKLSAENPKDKALLARLAKLYEEMERWEEAAQILSRLLQGQTGAQRGETFLRMAAALERAGKKQEAMQALEHASRLKPADAKLWLRLAQGRKQAGDTPGTISALKRAVELQPANRSLRLELCEALLASGDKRGAASQMQEAAKLSPDDAALWLRLSRLQQDLGDKKALIHTYKRLAVLKPNQPDLLYNMAIISLDMENLPEALKYLQDALRAKPGDRQIRETMLDVLVQMGQWKQAVKLARELIKEKPDPDLVMGLFGALSQSQPAELAKLMDLLLAQAPQDAKFYATRAALALEMQDTPGAVKALEQGIKAHPKALDLRWSLAGLYEAEKENQKALEQLGAILDENPEYPQAEERYLQLKTSILQSSGNKQ